MEERKVDQEELEKIDIFRGLQEFGKALHRLFWLPVLMAVLCGGLLGLRAWRSYTPMYASQVTFTIQLADSSLTDIGGSTSYYNKATAEQLTKTFPYLVQSELMQTKLRQAMGVERLNGSISAQTVDNTNLFSLRVTSTAAQDAYDILLAVTEVYPQVADYVIGNTELNLLTEPALAAEPYNEFRPIPTICKGAVLGLLLSLAMILLYAFTRRSIRDPEDIHKRLNQTCIATLPKVTFKKRGNAIDQTISIQNERVSGAFQESVRSMRIKFLREMQKRKAQVVMVTSTLPGEGKTTVAVNLALSLSQNGARVILVDLDLRKPSVKKALGVTEPSKGMPELLAGSEGSPAEALLPLKNSRLVLLAGDSPAADARQQISSRRLAAMLDQLRQEADYIVLDTPPCGILADSAGVSRVADCTLYVLRAGAVEVSHIMDSLQFLAESGTRMIGCVLNGIQTGQGGYGYGYGYGYSGYGYGYGYGKYSSHRKSKAADED